MEEKLPRRDVDADELKALAHPLRQRILYHLAFAGPATSTTIAAAFGESTGSASYHLRQLERFGFVEEVAERSAGRDRWWRLVPLDLRGIADDAVADDDTRAAGERLSRMRLERDRDLVDRYLANRHRFGEWEDKATFSSSAAHLPPEELADFVEEYVALLRRYWRAPEDRPDDAIPVAMLFYGFPWPGERPA